MKKPFVFGIDKHKTLPFVIAGITFFSKPLTVAEELPFAEVGDRFDAEHASTEATKAFITEQASFIATLLTNRLAPQSDNRPIPTIDTAWALNNTGMPTLPNIMQFLRSGQRPSGPLELGQWDSEPIEIDGFQFAMRQFSFAELLATADLAELSGVASTVTGSLEVLAQLLNARLLGYEGQDPRPAITAEWLGQHLTSEDVEAVTMLLQNGPDTAEGDDPNAPTLPDATPGASNISLA